MAVTSRRGAGAGGGRRGAAGPHTTFDIKRILLPPRPRRVRPARHDRPPPAPRSPAPPYKLRHVNVDATPRRINYVFNRLRQAGLWKIITDRNMLRRDNTRECTEPGGGCRTAELVYI
ncbi:hypothetical protein EVAR_65969_1 [Eumeta japonica]|uniref:Uncharacterized protein n=1 Tax=Eumeta variegata TaxID=151549 RepID=A0A4C1Z9I4_EUMVA|nr:hypothetical protein EVAR_65969_1 [Eumeta japonica]